MKMSQRCCRHLVSGTAALLSGVVLTACSSGDSSESSGADGAAPTDTETVLLSYMHDVQNAHYYWVQDKALDHQCGFNLELRTAGDVSNPLQLLVGGGADMALVDPLAYTTAVEQGLPVIAIGVDVAKSPMTFTSLASTGITSPADLVGKKVGLDGSDDSEWFLQKILTESLPADQIDQVQTPRIGSSTAPLFAGNVDAISVWTTATDIVARQAEGEQFNMIKVADYGIDMPGNVMVVTKEKLQKEPERVEALMATVLTGMTATLQPENAAEAVRATKERIDAPVEDVVLESLYETMWDIRTTDYWTQNGVGANDPAGYQSAVDLLVENGRLAEPIPVQQLFTDEVIDKVVTDAKVVDLAEVPGCGGTGQ